MIDINAVTPERLAAAGFNLNLAADRSLLRSTITNAGVVARGFKLPYAGYPRVKHFPKPFGRSPSSAASGSPGAPLGNAWYDALQAKVTKRFSHGVELTSSFTWQKELEMNSVNDVFNRRNQKNYASASQPFQFVTAFNYEVPKLTANKMVREVVGGWTSVACCATPAVHPSRFRARTTASTGCCSAAPV